MRKSVSAAAFGALLALGAPAAALEIVETAPTSAVAPTPAQQLVQQTRPPAPQAAPAAPFAVTAWVDRNDMTYAIGDTLSLWVQPKQDAYVTVYSMSAGSDPVRIFPNDKAPDNFVRAGEVRELGRPSEFIIRVGGPAGPDLIKVIASDRPIDPATPMGGRSLSVEGPSLAQFLSSSFASGPGRWATYEKVIRVVERASVAPQPVPVFADAGAATLRLAVDRDLYRIGETMSVRVSTERDCHLTLTSFGANGQAVQLFPNAHQPNGFLRGGDTLLLPGDVAAYRFSIEGPAGPETLLAQCHDLPQAFEGGTGFASQGTWHEAANRAVVLPVAASGPAGETRRAVVSYFVTN